MDVDIQNMTEDYEQKIQKKDEEINDLKKKIEEMSAEFAKMLRVLINFKIKGYLR